MVWEEVLARIHGRAVAQADEGYPAGLRQLSNPPAVLFTVGPWKHGGPIVAVVGSRHPTEDGMDVARAIAESLASEGVAVVSGLARGIDAAAHEGALAAGGLSGAVLGTSLDKVYPRENASLQQRLSASLGLMSEVRPGDAATRVTFATRNRLLAAISQAVVVVQGRLTSGSLITAREALRLGRPVAALPWDSREPLAEAPHWLIREGLATLVRGADDVLELLALGVRGRARSPRRYGRRESFASAGPVARSESRAAPDTAGRSRGAGVLPHDLTASETRLYRVLRRRPLPLDQLAGAASMSVPELGEALLGLELRGLARREPGGVARRTHRPR